MMRTKDVIRAAAFLSALSLLSGLPAAGAAESESAADKEYTQYLEAYDSRTYCYQTVQMEAAELSAGEGTSVEEAYRGREKPALVTSADGYAEWLVQIPQTGFYSMRIEYCSVEGTGGPVQRSIAIDGAIPFDEAGSVKLSRVFRDSEPVQHKDGQNDIRPAQEEIFEWRNEYIRDSQGYVGGRLEFYLTEGSHTIRFSSLAEPVALGTITLESFPEKVAAYSQVEEHYKEKGYQPVEGALEDGLSVVQAEDVYERSDQTLYAISDSSSSFNEPFSYQYQKLNAIGGSKWMNQGQWLSWQIQVPKSGLYKIGFRVKQNYTRDVEPARSLYIDGQLPFQEAASLTFPYQDGWTVSAAGGDTPYLFYLEEGTRTITLEASLGEVSESLRKASASLEALNRANWELLTIIGNRPDTYRDYNFAEYCPQVITTFREQAEILQSIADDWVARTGKQDANVAQIEAIVYQLNTMWKDPDKIAGLYGAVGDGETMNTAAIQAAIDACSAAGGGTVLFPKGVFLSGTLQLKGHITYQFARGAVLKGSGNMEDYRENGFYHNEFKKTVSFLWARDEQNIRLTGDGVIDLSAGLLAPDRSARWYGDGIDEAALTQEQKDECVFYPSQRPTQPIFFESCFDIAVDGIRVIDSPCWTITFSRCQRILVHHIVIDNSLIVSNSDGIHLSACKDAVISDSIFSCGDDCIAVTCITAEGEQDISERILIHHCHMRSRSAAVRLGHEQGKIRDVLISDLVITDSNRGFAIFSRTGGFVENVRIHDVILHTRIVAGAWWGKGEAVVICAAGSEGRIRNIDIRNLSARCEGGILLAGSEGNVENITLKDISLAVKEGPNYALYGGDLDLRPNLYIPGAADPGCPVYVSGVEGLVRENITTITD